MHRPIKPSPMMRSGRFLAGAVPEHDAEYSRAEQTAGQDAAQGAGSLVAPRQGRCAAFHAVREPYPPVIDPVQQPDQVGANGHDPGPYQGAMPEQLMAGPDTDIVTEEQGQQQQLEQRTGEPAEKVGQEQPEDAGQIGPLVIANQECGLEQQHDAAQQAIDLARFQALAERWAPPQQHPEERGQQSPQAAQSQRAGAEPEEDRDRQAEQRQCDFVHAGTVLSSGQGQDQLGRLPLSKTGVFG